MLKKLLITLGIILGLVVGFGGSAFAQDSIDESKRIEMITGTGEYARPIIWSWDGTANFYHVDNGNGTQSLKVVNASDDFMFYKYDAETKTLMGTYTSGFTFAGSFTYTTHKIYTDETLTKVFFSSPGALETALPMIPKTIVNNLGHGGLLGLGLMILAIMLGVSLVPRLIRLFHR